MMNKTHLVVRGTPKFDGTGGATIPNLKGTDSNSNLKKPNQSEVQNLKVRAGLQLVTTNSATLEDPGLQLVTTNSATLGPDPRVTTNCN